MSAKFYLTSIFDSDFSLSKHVQNVCKSCFVKLCDLDMLVGLLQLTFQEPLQVQST